MELDDAFTKAALYETCLKSNILRNIDLDNVDTQTLRKLVNKNNALSMREFPIVISKVLVKFGLTFVTEKMPRLRAYINPENMSTNIEADELACLEVQEQAQGGTFQPSIYMIVAKNIAASVLGTSIQSLRELITKTVEPIKPGTSIPARSEVPFVANKIQINSVQQAIPDIDAPKHFTNFADTFKSPRNDNNNSDAPTPSSVKNTTEHTVSVERVREKKRTEAATSRQNQRDTVVGLHRAEIHASATSTVDDDDDDRHDTDMDVEEAAEEEEEDTVDSVSVASEQLPEATDTDAADIVDRYIKEHQPRPLLLSPPPSPPQHHKQQQQALPSIISNNEELTKPLRSISADEFMSIIETEYTSLLNDGDKAQKDNALDNRRQQRYYDRYSPTPKPPPSVASLTFDDDEDEDEM